MQLHYIAELPVASHDMHPSIRRGVMEKWQRHWSSTQEIASNKLREVKPEIGFWKSGCSLSRYTETRIARLRIGHTYLTHVYLLKGETYPECPQCKVRVTVKHILGECPEYAQARRTTGLKNFPECLGTDMTCDQIMSFLRQTGLIKEI